MSQRLISILQELDRELQEQLSHRQHMPAELTRNPNGHSNKQFLMMRTRVNTKLMNNLQEHAKELLRGLKDEELVKNPKRKNDGRKRPKTRK